MDFKVRKAIKIGDSVGVSLTKEFAKLDIKVGDLVYIYSLDNMIIVYKIENINSVPILIDKNKLRLLKTLIFKYSKYKSFDEYIEDLVDSEIDRWKNWFKRPVRI